MDTLLVCSFGALSHAQVCRSLELFAAAVIQPRRPRPLISGGAPASLSTSLRIEVIVSMTLCRSLPEVKNPGKVVRTAIA